MLTVKGLKVSIEDKEILKGVDILVETNKIHALMGQNGSGKSTLAQTLMGHPLYEVTLGSAVFEGKDLFSMEPNERSLAGLFLSFQYPSEVQGATISSYLRMLYNKRHENKLSPVAFKKLLKEKMEILGIKEEFMGRYLNDGFSGGEKKRMEILQMLVVEPKLAILDEVDSGLDVDAIKVVAKAVNHLVKEKGMAVMIITHYTRVLNYIEPDKVHIMQDGAIVKEGGKDLAHKLEELGFAQFGE
jgi:Fe-S cluster assembly ATP-binding protein